MCSTSRFSGDGDSLRGGERVIFEAQIGVENLGPWALGAWISPVQSNMASWEIPELNTGFNGTPSMNGGCSIATFDYRRAMNGLLNGL